MASMKLWYSMTLSCLTEAKHPLMFFLVRDEVRFNLQSGVVDIPEVDVVMVLAFNNMFDNL